MKSPDHSLLKRLISYAAFNEPIHVIMKVGALTTEVPDERSRTLMAQSTL